MAQPGQQEQEQQEENAQSLAVIKRCLLMAVYSAALEYQQQLDQQQLTDETKKQQFNQYFGDFISFDKNDEWQSLSDSDFQQSFLPAFGTIAFSELEQSVGTLLSEAYKSPNVLLKWSSSKAYELLKENISKANQHFRSADLAREDLFVITEYHLSVTFHFSPVVTTLEEVVLAAEVDGSKAHRDSLSLLDGASDDNDAVEERSLQDLLTALHNSLTNLDFWESKVHHGPSFLGIFQAKGGEEVNIEDKIARVPKGVADILDAFHLTPRWDTDARAANALWAYIVDSVLPKAEKRSTYSYYDAFKLRDSETQTLYETLKHLGKTPQPEAIQRAIDGIPGQRVAPINAVGCR